MKPQKCRVTLKDGTNCEARFLGIFQFSQVLEPSPLIGGHNGGTIAYPVAVVEFDGELVQKPLTAVQLESEVTT